MENFRHMADIIRILLVSKAPAEIPACRSIEDLKIYSNHTGNTRLVGFNTNRNWWIITTATMKEVDSLRIIEALSSY